MKELITTLYQYGEWANARLLAKAGALTPAELGQRFSKGAEPILPTFGHLVGADIRWLARWREETPPPVAAGALTPLRGVARGARGGGGGGPGAAPRGRGGGARPRGAAGPRSAGGGRVGGPPAPAAPGRAPPGVGGGAAGRAGVGGGADRPPLQPARHGP